MCDSAWYVLNVRVQKGKACYVCFKKATENVYSIWNQLALVLESICWYFSNFCEKYSYFRRQITVEENSAKYLSLLFWTIFKSKHIYDELSESRAQLFLHTFYWVGNHRMPKNGPELRMRGIKTNQKLHVNEQIAVDTD